MVTYLEIDQEVGSLFPDVVVGGFLVDHLDRLDATADVEGLVREVQQSLLSTLVTNDGLMRDLRVIDWRWAIARSGLRASSFRGSVEQLGRRFLRGEAFSTPLAAVTAYCAFSAQHLAPLGAYDWDRLPLPQIRLRLCRDGDTYEPLAGRAHEMPLTKDLVVYGCGDEIISYAWNVRDSARSCLLPGTRRGVFIGEAATASQQQASASALIAVAHWLATHGVSVGPVTYATAAERRTALTLA